MSQLRVVDRVKLLVINRFGGRVFSRQELLKAWNETYPDSPDSSVLPADYCVNTKTAPNLKKGERFLFCVKEGKYRIYDCCRDGDWGKTEDGARQLL